MGVIITLVLLGLAAVVVLWLLQRHVVLWQATSGSVLDKLAAPWRGSLTNFVLGWPVVLSMLSGALSWLASTVQDPQFTAVWEGISSFVPPALASRETLVVGLIGLLARNLHNPPSAP